MSHFNQCSHLIKDQENAVNRYFGLLRANEDPLQTMLDMQRSLQVRLAKDKPGTNMHPDDLETAGEVLTWLRNQDDYIADETRELYTALGGMSNGEKAASAVWKPWKAQHEEMFSKNIRDLSAYDQLEIKFELIDQFHFFMNKFMALGMDAEEIFTLYFLKNAENFARQDQGY
ncbi:dCTP pyrophosphatase, phage-associated [Yersinia phage phiR1-RT]|uniref:dCTP pyrophosphatase, phage-associated n=1 Tax=Yersinia phage phiR1-RT TaxID=1206558 RepID=I7KR00_BPPR1|nr:dUTPase [Yersinia phage phiR1-RT]CCI88605.1 dCTP pyrophosphatase, phage-associated [Yersinia phage phiR1-RT]